MIKMKTSNGIVYTDSEALGAIPNGTPIKKVNSEPGDMKDNGALGIIIGSVDNPVENQIPEKPFVKYLYFIKWNGFDRPIAVADYKIKTLDK